MAAGLLAIVVTEDLTIHRETAADIASQADGRGAFVRVDVSDPASTQAMAEATVERFGGIDLLVTDIIMPGMDGRTLAEHLKESLAGLKVLFISGYTYDVIVDQGILDAGVNLLMKPFTRSELLENVRRVIDAG